MKRISRRTAAELCDIRLVLATHAARLAAERINEGQLKVWSRLAGEIEKAATAHDLPAYYRLNQQFHLAMIEFTGNDGSCNLSRHHERTQPVSLARAGQRSQSRGGASRAPPARRRGPKARCRSAERGGARSP